MSILANLMPTQASTVAASVDQLYFFLLGLLTFFTIGISAVIVFFGFRYRRRTHQDAPKPIHGHNMLEVTWIVIPLLILIVLFVWSASVYFKMTRPPEDAVDMFVVGKQWMWKIQHPGGHREINEMHVPINTPIKVTLTSEDVVHSFYVPAFRIKMDVVPGRYSSAWFEAIETGEFHLFCAEYCGTEHSAMIGKIIVMEQAEYDEWLSQRGVTLDNTMVARGEKLYTKLGCGVCHNSDAQLTAPFLAGLYNKPVTLEGGRVLRADAAYIRSSVLEPAKQVVRGYQPIMPTYKEQVTEEDVLDLIAYIQSL